MANSHPGSYCGQDAYNDMFVTENICGSIGMAKKRQELSLSEMQGGSEDA